MGEVDDQAALDRIIAEVPKGIRPQLVTLYRANGATVALKLILGAIFAGDMQFWYRTAGERHKRAKAALTPIIEAIDGSAKTDCHLSDETKREMASLRAKIHKQREHFEELEAVRPKTGALKRFRFPSVPLMPATAWANNRKRIDRLFVAHGLTQAQAKKVVTYLLNVMNLAKYPPQDR